MRKLIVLLFVGSMISCHKEKMESMTGTYSGEGLYVKYHHSGSDTLMSYTFSEVIKVKKEGKWFKFDKTEYPYSYEMCAKKLAKRDSLTVTPSYVLPQENWTMYFTKDSLYGTFRIINGWSGKNEGYYFRGSK